MVVRGAKAEGEASLLFLEFWGGWHDAARHCDLDRDGQQGPPPPVPAQLQPSPEHWAGILAVGPHEIADEQAGVFVKPTENFRCVFVRPCFHHVLTLY